MGDKFTTRGFATRGEFVTHSWGYFATRGGIGDVPFVIHRGFSIHRLGASPLVDELPRPYFFSIRDSANSDWLRLAIMPTANQIEYTGSHPITEAK